MMRSSIRYLIVHVGFSIRLESSTDKEDESESMDNGTNTFPNPDIY
jgi:hydrogenase maturation factor